MTFMRQEAWARKYNVGLLSEPIPLAIRILALIVPILLIAALFYEVGMPVFETFVISPGGLQT